ncbi:MAG: aldo/keto reductase [Planctomycetota bacterium]|jgi:aryl-alcohol dehydrogenase-like predicted oxidoreductase|nr:aldo/keto reductase [Planctomycetota bacterium]MDP6518281.1 aldo/keto reductase [Planctomycetota bacterium]MDP6955132.1 aldo/keto reductase [Planctomycetota bacterium]
MRTRKLGRTELEIPVICFGAWAIGGWWWGAADDEQSLAALGAALESGTNAIDTAPVYGFGHSEELVGRFLAAERGRRERVIVMTKAGLRWDTDEGQPFFETKDGAGRSRRIFRNSRPASLRAEVEASLGRLGIERIDLLQVHWPDGTTPIDESMGALLELRGEGKIREIGVSNFSPGQMAEAQAALGQVPLASDQPPYNLLERASEEDVLPHAIEQGIGIVVYSPLHQGLLTGRVTADRVLAEDDGRRKKPTFSQENRRRVNAFLEATVAPIAETQEASLGQVLLAWTVDQPGITAALVGARTADQARENAAAGSLQLSAVELAAIRAGALNLELELPRPKAVGGLRGFIKRLARG